MKAIYKSAFGILASVIALFVVLAVLVANRTSEMMTEAAERTVKSVVNETAVKVDRQIRAVEAVTRLGGRRACRGARLHVPDHARTRR